MSDRPRLGVIVASTRPGRVGLPVAHWLQARAVRHGGFDVALLDLAEIDLPFMDEPNHPRLGRYIHEHTKRWSATIDAIDAFAIVMPEYNYGFSAPLKNAIDYLHNEWHDKPAGLVSYGGVSAGTRAAQMLKQVLSALRMVTVADAVSIPFVAQFVDDEGRLTPNEVMDDAADAMLAELLRIQNALVALRPAVPSTT